MKITDMNLNQLTKNVLIKNGFMTLSDLAEYANKASLLLYPGIRHKRLAEILIEMDRYMDISCCPDILECPGDIEDYLEDHHFYWNRYVRITSGMSPFLKSVVDVWRAYIGLAPRFEDDEKVTDIKFEITDGAASIAWPERDDVSTGYEDVDFNVYLTANDYQEAAKRTIPDDPEYPILLNAVMGMCGEAGECMDILKKNMFQKHPLDKGELAEEIGDLLWYVAEACTAIGYDLETVMSMNIDKLNSRYPNGFDPDRSISRDISAEKKAMNLKN